WLRHAGQLHRHRQLVGTAAGGRGEVGRDGRPGPGHLAGPTSAVVAGLRPALRPARERADGLGALRTGVLTTAAWLQWLPATSSRPISMRRISLVPAPIAYSLASRRMRPVAYSLM